MSIPEPEQVLVAAGDEVEPLLRGARAQVAQLSLQLRSAEHEAGALEAALNEDDTSARDLLRAGLAELVESRRHELEQDLEQELVRAAAAVSAARSEAARIRLTASPAAVADPPSAGQPGETPPAVEPSEAVAPRRLQIVADDEGVHTASGDEQAATELVDEPRPEPDPDPDSIEVADADERAWWAAMPGVETEPPGPAPADEAAAAPEAAADEADDDSSETAADAAPRSGSDPDLPTAASLLRELVTAAVTAAVAQAVGAVGAARQGPSPGWTDQPTGVNPMLPVHAPRSRPPFWRQLLHADVILPLVLVVIVFVVLLAWVG